MARIAAPMRHGSDPEILRLAIPALGALVAEPLFILVDAAVVGRLGTVPLAGLGVAATVLTTAVNLCIFLAYGTTAAVARRIGAGDRRGALAVGVDGMWLAAATGVLLVVAGWFAAPSLVAALGPSAEVADAAVTYLRVSLAGIPPMLVVFAATGVLRGLQDTRTPLVVAVAASVLNAVLSVVLVLGLGLGIGGSALGTVITQWAALAAYLVVLLPGVRAAGVTAGAQLAGILAAARAGWHLLLRTVLLRAVLVLATWVATGLGDDATAAHAVVFAVWSLLALALDALAIAGQALTGRFLGAGDVAGVRASTRRMVEWGVFTGCVLGVLVVATSTLVPAAFSDDPGVRTAMTAALVVAGLLQPLCGVVFVLDGVLIGAGDFRFLAWAGLVPLAAFVPAALVVRAYAGDLLWLWVALGVFMAARLLVLGVRSAGTGWMVLGVGPARARDIP